jgi:hypothetical protein
VVVVVLLVVKVDFVLRARVKRVPFDAVVGVLSPGAVVVNFHNFSFGIVSVVVVVAVGVVVAVLITAAAGLVLVVIAAVVVVVVIAAVSANVVARIVSSISAAVASM